MDGLRRRHSRLTPLPRTVQNAALGSLAQHQALFGIRLEAQSAARERCPVECLHKVIHSLHLFLRLPSHAGLAALEPPPPSRLETRPALSKCTTGSSSSL